MQVTFSFGFTIEWDKVANQFGAKNVVQDATARVCQEDEEWRDNLASVGLHLLSLAIHQCIITPVDLERLEIGKPFKLSHLIARRKSGNGGPQAEEVDNMYVPQERRYDVTRCCHKFCTMHCSAYASAAAFTILV